MAFSVVLINSFASSSISSIKSRSGPVALSGPLWGFALFFDRKKKGQVRYYTEIGQLKDVYILTVVLSEFFQQLRIYTISI